MIQEMGLRPGLLIGGTARSTGESQGPRPVEVFDAETLQSVTALRRIINTILQVDAMERLTGRLAKFPSNEEFVRTISGARTVYA